MSRWESNAMFAQKEYGAYVDWEERFYNCPFCDEPIYEEDWEGRVPLSYLRGLRQRLIFSKNFVIMYIQS